MELPIELLCEIALAAPGAYLVLVQCCKSIQLNIRVDIMCHFTRPQLGTKDSLFRKQIAWRLPNGALHSPDVLTPAVVFNVALEENESEGIYNLIRIPNSDMFVFGGCSCLQSLINHVFYIHDGDCFWFSNNKLHRDDDLPAITIKTPSQKFWFQHGQLHRNYDRPAKITEFLLDSFSEEDSYLWYSHGECHRFGKPARMYINSYSKEVISQFYCVHNVDFGIANPWYLADF